MLNIGLRPTVNGTLRTVEVHLFDFNTDIYDEVLTLHFIEKLRAEQKFAGLEALKAQLRQDEADARRCLA
jgi:FAD synthase